ncbi:MAG: cobalamin B12-binding domain-containing protein [Candidatus Syntropharchaeia archaeon]
MKKIKILLTLSYFEGHDVGLRVIAKRCVDAGMETIYTRFRSIDEIVSTARDEDVDLIGISSSTGTHNFIISELMKKLKENDLDIPVVIGGVIPDDDVPKLLEMGVKKVFTPGIPPGESVKMISEIATGQTA